MSKLSQKQIGIDDEFQYYFELQVKSKEGKCLLQNPVANEEEIAYYAAIKRFKQLSKIVTPQDSIVWVIDTIHQIQKCAIKYEKLSKFKLIQIKNEFENQKITVLGADSLFPIIVYCLVKSRYDYWHRWIFMMNKFYTDHVLSFGQTGFCFSLIQAAMHYVLKQNHPILASRLMM
eukprot:UN06140